MYDIRYLKTLSLIPRYLASSTLLIHTPHILLREQSQIYVMSFTTGNPVGQWTSSRLVLYMKSHSSGNGNLNVTPSLNSIFFFPNMAVFSYLSWDVILNSENPDSAIASLMVLQWRFILPVYSSHMQIYHGRIDSSGFHVEADLGNSCPVVLDRASRVLSIMDCFSA